MKTQKKRLDLKKNSLVELNDNQLHDVQGGTSPVCLSVLSVVNGTLVSVFWSIVIEHTVEP